MNRLAVFTLVTASFLITSCDATTGRNSKTDNQGGGQSEVSQKACSQEAKQCPDGSYVSRTGPNCEFAPCPGVK